MDILICGDPHFRLSQITWRPSVAHHPTEDNCGNCARQLRQLRAA
jgi:hypothetical protein